MQKSLKVGIAVAVAGVAIIVAVRKHNAPTSSNAAADLQRARADLALAQSQDARKYPLTEIAESKPKRPKGPANFDATDAARRSPVVSEAERIALQTAELPRTKAIGTAAPTLATPSVLVVPRAPVPTPTVGGFPRTHATGAAAGPDSDVPGTGPWGATIRGGAVDGDHCDPPGIHGVQRPTYAGDPTGPGSGSVRPGGVPVGGGPMRPSVGGGLRPPTL